ncbi:MAG: hypothetical protein GY822_22825 [Deltaproteobacteria bacterium]|nr:hypothetical protein [Deltaproteobacteria bacterium]
MHFSKWFPLDVVSIRGKAPDAAGAIQLRAASGVLDYPTGKSAMVFYFFSQESMQKSLLKHFDDEIYEPGARGKGPLLFRFSEESSGAAGLEELYDNFEKRFGCPPLLHSTD